MNGKFKARGAKNRRPHTRQGVGRTLIIYFNAMSALAAVFEYFMAAFCLIFLDK